MAQDAQDDLIKPGLDSTAHTQTMQQNVASAVAKITGESHDPNEFVPAAAQKPVTENEAEKPDPLIDFEDIQAGFKGKPRTEKSNNFLKRLMEKFKKQYPDQELKLEK